MIRRAILAFALLAGITPAFAQVPAPVPALPDSERRTTYSITGTTCICAVNMALYGDSTDYQNWVEVFINGARVNFNDATFGWTITSPSGSLANLARPITDAVLTFNGVQTGTIQIVGARRPRRTSQFSENTGVPARNVNQVVTDITATLREMWDKTNDMTGRGLFSQPGNTMGPLPLPAACSGKFLGFDVTGLIPQCSTGGPGSGNVTGPGSSVNGHFAIFSGASGAIIADHAIVGTDLPAPGASSLGGVQSLTCSTSNWFNTLSTAGAFGCSQPAFSDITGQATTAQITNNAVDNTKIRQGVARSVIGVTGNATANEADIQGTANQVLRVNSAGTALAFSLVPQATVQKFTTGTGATYTTPAASTYAIVKFCGPGGGGSGSGTGTTGGTGGTGTATVFNGITAGAGTGATASLPGTGGTVSGGAPLETWPGASGGAVQTGVAGNFLVGGIGAGTVLFGGASGGAAAVAATGAGGSGGAFNGAGNSGGGGGSGACATQIVAGGGATYTYTIGTAGGAGTAGTSGSVGFAGSTGYLEATEF